VSQESRKRTKRSSGTSKAEKKKEKAFTPDVLESTVIAIPLLDEFKKKGGLDRIYDVIIDINLEYPGGRDIARRLVCESIRRIVKGAGESGSQGIYRSKTDLSEQYIFAKLKGALIQDLVRRDRAPEGSPGSRPAPRAIYHVWPDFEIERLTVKSISTVKADAARNAFAAYGHDIVWAVLDSGIDADHPHFRRYRNLELGNSILHCDFTAVSDVESDETATGPEALQAAKKQAIASSRAACRDDHGHGTHVAGIIAGALSASDGENRVRIVGETNQRDEAGDVKKVEEEYSQIAGMAPSCKLLSLKVLNENGKGSASNLIAAIEYLQKINGNGRRLLVHGANLSVGYDFEPKWFACGQSPLCVEVDRLVRSGVVVVVAAGNTGYGWNQSAFRGAVAAGMDLTINDPGNAELAITVGSTHRDMPHVYGVSYFSSKGPTGDGRMKPDLVAPGEKIISAASRQRKTGAGNAAAAAPSKAKAAAVADQTIAAAAVDAPPKAENGATEARYREDSGTSMAAPHVSGVIAAFLSVRREFIGRPDRVKQIFLDTATDLKRAPSFQGRGLVDLMRAIQSV
jgi:serine protease AprX